MKKKNENSNSTHLKLAFSEGSWLDQALWTVNRFKTADKRLASRTAQNIFSPSAVLYIVCEGDNFIIEYLNCLEKSYDFLPA